MRPRPLSLLLVALACTVPTRAQEVTAPASPLVVPVETERVEVDLVVRDRHEGLVRDLRPEEVGVLEDGVPQRLESFQLVDRQAAAEAAMPTLVALAFDRLGPAARSFAREAALEYVARDLDPGSEAGVFSIDRGLTVQQPFTDDREALRHAVDRATSLTPTTFAGQRERELTRNAYHGLGEGFGQAHVAPAEQRGAPECRGREEVRTRLTELLASRLVEGFEAMERDQCGFGTAHALLALVGALQELPGRKAVVLFSEGLAIPSDVEATYRSVVSTANRARVSLYTVDAEGLRVASATDEMRRSADTLRTRVRNSSDGGRLTEDSPLALLERNQETLLSPEGTLGQLADQTGGFVIRGTNDPAAGFARIGEELRTHYVLSYTPKNRTFDGRFRTLAVKIDRPHVRVQARKGYLAVKTPLPVPVLPYEAPALARLEPGASPQRVPVRVRGLQFPEEPALSRVSILVEVPARALLAERDGKAGVFRRELVIVALVRDTSRGVVQKLSQRYVLSGRLDPSGEADRDSILLQREVSLPAGNYTLEAVAWDARAREAGVATAALTVPRAEVDRLRASSLVVVSHAEKAGAPAGPQAGLLQLQDVQLYPNLGQPLRRDGGRPLAFFLRAWPAAERPGVDARVEVVRGKQTVASARPMHLRPDGDGTVQLVSSFPVESLVPGAYELRVTLTDGRDAETRTAALSVAP